MAMESLVKSNLFSILLSLVLVTGFVPAGYAATPKENLDCTSVNKIVSVGKTKLICAEILTGNKWIKVISVSTKTTQIKVQATQIIEALSKVDSSTVTSFLTKGATLQQSFDQKNKEWRDAEFSLNTFKTEKFAAENELKNLPASISQASSLVSQSQAALAAPQQTYTSLLSQLNAMSSEYSSAYSAGGCGYYNSYYDVVISRYNSMQSQVNAARATYESYYANYSNNLQRYRDLLNSQITLNSKISELGQKLTQSLASFTAIDAQLKLMTKEKELFDVVLSNSNFYFSEPVDLANSIQEVLASSSKTWSKKLSPLYQRYQVLKYDLNLMAARL